MNIALALFENLTAIISKLDNIFFRASRVSNLNLTSSLIVLSLVKFGVTVMGNSKWCHNSVFLQCLLFFGRIWGLLHKLF